MNFVISIVVPMYNSERKITTLLDSIYSAMYLPFEVICINDGSTDETERTVIEYQKRHQEVILLNQKNMGPSTARNRGISKALGEWILFADSDDTYSEEGLKRVQREIVDNPDSELFVFSYKEKCTTGDKVIGVNQDEVWSVRDFLEEGYQAADYLFVHSVWNKVYKKAIIALTGGFDERIKLGEDAIFNALYLSTVNKVKVCSTPLYNYFIGGGSLSHDKKDLGKIWDSYLMIYSSISHLLQKYNLYEVDALVFRNYYFGTINSYINSYNIDHKDEQTLRMMLSNHQWIEKIEYIDDCGGFEKLIVLLASHRCISISLLLCKLQRYRRLYRKK